MELELKRTQVMRSYPVAWESEAYTKPPVAVCKAPPAGKEAPPDYDTTMVEEVMSDWTWNTLCLLYRISSREQFAGFCEDWLQNAFFRNRDLDPLWDAIQHAFTACSWMR